MKIVKMRVGKVVDLTTNELLYNVEFKFANQHRFMGYSIENWKDIWDARLAIRCTIEERPHFIQWEPIRMVKFLCPIVKNHKSNHEQTNSKCSNRND